MASFVPDDFDVPPTLVLRDFRLEALGPGHNERDHEAWMSSLDHIRSTPGFPDGEWPSQMDLDENLSDLEGHARDFDQRTGFTYSVLDGDEVVGCVYIYPTTEPEHDAQIASWVRASRADLDEPLWRAVTDWLDAVWPFRNVVYAPRAEEPASSS